MDYLALYRKYRPSELNEVVGQTEVKNILSKSVADGTISHAYLFFGPRGTGKTTMAKIFAKMVNCESPVDGNACNNCDCCLNVLKSSDVIEIDAASNNGVDEIRDLREKANLVPSFAKYKVYIIDEVHMLTTQAFNAILKTLEEPPKHVIFILATTEYYKIPLTISSRCQKFQFNKLSVEDISRKLREIADKENIVISDEALLEVAKISDGGLRDSINFLDQLRSNEQIGLEEVYDVCGSVPIRDIFELFKNIHDCNVDKVVEFFEKLDNNGKSYVKFFEDVILLLKDVILYKKNVNSKYIKSNYDTVVEFSKLFDYNDAFYLIDSITKLFDKLKNISRQSIVVISNFLSIMHHFEAINSELISENLTLSEKNIYLNEPEENNVTTIKSVNDDDINEDNITFNMLNNKDIIINNAFTLANKDLKNNLHDKFTSISNYLTDVKYKKAAGILVDTDLMVVGGEYLIFTAKTDAIIDKIYSNCLKCSELLNLIFDGNYYFAIISLDDWNLLRDEYINNIQSGKKYKLLDLIFDNKDESNDESKKITVVDKLFDLVGEENVIIK